jgi:acetyl-CoA carboxylase biotin carboxyl carrier protein
MRNKKKEAAVPAPSETGRKPHPFDVPTVERLIALMAQHDLSEIDLHDGESRIRLRKGAPAMAAFAPPPAFAANPAPAAAPAAPAADRRTATITSPTPGTFYAKPSPEEPAYVKVGSRVKPDTVVCKIEAMKIFNEIAAECTGTIVEVLVENAQPVEYGQPLFRVET